MRLTKQCATPRLEKDDLMMVKRGVAGIPLVPDTGESTGSAWRSKLWLVAQVAGVMMSSLMMSDVEQIVCQTGGVPHLAQL
jgi:hypothetical protein